MPFLPRSGCITEPGVVTPGFEIQPLRGKEFHLLERRLIKTRNPGWGRISPGSLDRSARVRAPSGKVIGSWKPVPCLFLCTSLRCTPLGSARSR
jgi:hypothetical protein